MSAIKQKILLFLSAGFDFTYAYHPNKKWRILENAYYKWRQINIDELKIELDKLYRSQSIGKKYNSDGSFSVFLTKKGRVKALACNFSEMKNGKWDKKWRMVIFDVPEKIRQGRNALRWKLKELGFYELQKSVFVFPYECKKQINFIVEFFKMEKYVRYGVLESIDNDSHLRKVFNLNQ